MNRSLSAWHALFALVFALGMFAMPAYASGMNPCAANPCAANPCAANPCAANPCAANPCAANPCTANPCTANPCTANPCTANPCTANPCTANPCTANPCTANPCTANPCAANPCAANPCAAKVAANPCAVKAIKRPAHYTPVTGDHAALARKGKALFNDESLSLNETSCAACHDGHAMFKKSFSNPYPHHVNMAKAKFDIDPIHLDEMVQLCMIVPMASKPFAWDSQELAAMVAYLQDVQRDFIKAQK